MADAALLSADSESETSEDEEVARKISEAVWDPGMHQPQLKPTQVPQKSHEISLYNNSTSGSSDLTSLSKKINKMRSKSSCDSVRERPSQDLPSKRYQAQDNEESDAILNTTPEFRAYVARQLIEWLDKDLASRMSDGVWALSEKSDHTDRGIKLFSDSVTYCRLGSENESAPPTVSSIHSKERVRKQRLSTSSESSEDERIKACVFSAVDIQHENDLLAQVSAPPSETVNEMSSRATLTGDVSVGKSGCAITHMSANNIRKHKKKKKLKEKADS